MSSLATPTSGSGSGGIGTNIVFGDSSGFANRKRSLEVLDGVWTPQSTNAPTPVLSGRENKKVKSR